MQFGTRFGQGPIGDVAQQASTAARTALVRKEAIEFALHAATTKAAQSGHEHGQGQLARAREGAGAVGVAGQGCKGRAMQVFGQLSQNKLYRITVLRQKSCQPQVNNQLNQQLTYSSGLSSVDWGQCPMLAKHPSRTSKMHLCAELTEIRQISLQGAY